MGAVESHNPGVNLVLRNNLGEEDAAEDDEADPVVDLVAAEVEGMVAAGSGNTRDEAGAVEVFPVAMFESTAVVEDSEYRLDEEAARGVRLLEVEQVEGIAARLERR